MANPLPVTVIGGYLGAGKTTLLNALLAEARGVRLAVIVNDFGSVNIDAALITNRSGETVSLANGCICCSIGDNLPRPCTIWRRAAMAPSTSSSKQAAWLSSTGWRALPRVTRVSCSTA